MVENPSGGTRDATRVGRRGFLRAAGALAAGAVAAKRAAARTARFLFVPRAGELACLGGPRAVPSGLQKRWPLVTDDERRAVQGVLDRGVLYGPHSPESRGLEEAWARFVGVKHCIATGSGTSALHMAVAAAGVGPGDEVITAAYSWYSTASCITHQNGIPVFVDTDPRTFNIDPRKIEEKISPRTRAIIPVHLYGLPAEMDEINAIAAKHGLVVIEDACHAHGAYYKGKRAGSLGDMGTFSLNATKNLPAGEGGLLTTNESKYVDEALSLRQFGTYRGGERSEHGWQYRPQEMPSAFARARVPRLDAENAVRQRNAAYLTKRLGEIPGVIPPHVPSDRTHVYHMYRIRLDPAAAGVSLAPRAFREKVQRALRAEGVSLSNWVSVPLPAFRIYQLRRGYGKGCPWSCPIAPSKVEYRPEDYPETVRMLEDSFVLTSALYPPNGEPLMRAYADAFEKVLSNLGTVAAL